MYLRESKQRRADGSVVTYLQLAENSWGPERRPAEARILCNCGRAEDPAVVERLRRLARSILRRCSPEEVVTAGPEWRLVCAWPYGDVYALEALWQRLPGWRWLARLARLPGMLPLLELAYRGFLRGRPALQALAARWEPTPGLSPHLEHEPRFRSSAEG